MDQDQVPWNATVRLVVWDLLSHSLQIPTCLRYPYQTLLFNWKKPGEDLWKMIHERDHVKGAVFLWLEFCVVIRVIFQEFKQIPTWYIAKYTINFKEVNESF